MILQSKFWEGRRVLDVISLHLTVPWFIFASSKLLPHDWSYRASPLRLAWTLIEHRYLEEKKGLVTRLFMYSSTATTCVKTLPLIYVIYHLAIMKTKSSCLNIHCLTAGHLLPGKSTLWFNPVLSFQGQLRFPTSSINWDLPEELHISPAPGQEPFCALFPKAEFPRLICSIQFGSSVTSTFVIKVGVPASEEKRKGPE